MPNDDHVAMVGRGAAAWNAWRAEHGETPNFSRAGLRGLDLSGFDLSQANLRQADLRGTNLSQANLSRAHLDGANFFKAVLDGANPRQAQRANIGEGKLGAVTFRLDPKASLVQRFPLLRTERALGEYDLLTRRKVLPNRLGNQVRVAH